MSSNMNTHNLFNLDVQSYTLPELMAIVDVNEPDPHTIVVNTNKYINKYKTSSPKLATFFREIQSQLLRYASGLGNTKSPYAPIEEGFSNMGDSDSEYPSGQQQTDDWDDNEYPQQNDTNQTNKNTDRTQKIQVYGNQHVPMNKEQLGVNNTYNLPVAQDVLNPNLKNVITRFINLDSQFRQYTSGTESSSTDYTLDLSDTLKNVLSIKLFSYQIPYSWYVIDVTYGNTCLWITENNTNIRVSISSGNYTISQFVDALNTSFTTAGFTFTVIPVSVGTNNAKITLNLYGGVFNAGESDTFTISESTIITFYDFSGKLQCTSSCLKTVYLNQTLGWLMGFKAAYINVISTGNVASAVIDLNGTKYLILVIDDYNQNHLNSGLVSITEYIGNIKIPFVSQDLPYTCISANTNSSSQNDTNNSLIVSDKLNVNLSGTQVLLPSAPRTMTQSQLYSYNEINKNQNLTSYRSKAPTSADILSIIPLKISGASTGSLLVDFSGSLQDYTRTYFGPVDIDRMHVKLLDDKGNVLNLNGGDWCVTLICECLYQY